MSAPPVVPQSPENPGGEAVPPGEGEPPGGSRLHRGVVFLGLALWVVVAERDGAALLLRPEADLLGILLFVTAARRTGLGTLDALAWAVLSRRLHLRVAAGLEFGLPLMALSWPLWLSAVVRAGPADDRDALLLFHLGLTFDAGHCASFGVGMSPGWEPWALNLLLLLAVSRRLTLPGAPLPPASQVRPFLALFALLWLLAWHAGDPVAGLTGPVVATAACLILYARVCLPLGLAHPTALPALFLGGLPLLLSAVGTGLAIDPSPAFLWRRRIFAGGLHPNLLAAWALLLLLLEAETTAAPATVDRPANPPLTGFHRLLALALLVLVLIGSGSRSTLLLAGLALAPRLLGLLRLPTPAGPWLARLLLGGLGLGVLVAMAGRILDRSMLIDVLQNERGLIWQAAWRNIVEAPWTGHGWLAFSWLPQWLPPARALSAWDWCYPHTHQLGLELLLAGGLPLLGLASLAVVHWFRERRPRPARWWPGLLCLAQGIGDFVWFCPSLLGLTLLWLLTPADPPADPAAGADALGGAAARARAAPVPPAPVSPAQGAAPTPVDPGRHRLALVGLLVAGLAQAAPYRGLLAFEAALNTLGRGGDWSSHLDQAIAGRPHRPELSFQRLLWRWSTGLPPGSDDLARLRGLQRALPGSYLPPFLLGRLHLLGGEPASASAFLEQSLAREPRDVTGIRWGLAALAAAAASQSWEAAAGEAALRTPWGPALVLDHPDLGPRACAVLLGELQAARPVGYEDWRTALLLADALAERQVLTDLPLFDLCPATAPAWLSDLTRSLRLRTRPALPWPPLATSTPPGPAELATLGLSSSHELARQAARAGRVDLVTRLAEHRRAIWPYRTKHREDLWTDWFLALAVRRSPPTPPDPGLLDRPGQLDPGNPWILRLLGDLQDRAGQGEAARATWRQALACLPGARRDPCFSNGPRIVQGPEGDQWTLLFEKALRHYDPTARGWHAAAWQELTDSLVRRIATGAGDGSDL